ncbi:MAG TPA: methionyl-tRNA formyltransferase, partial [Halothiobacillaceae bacterium]|nr:methionyl-tRNA formyltransferase [Halothiobacillaceae bacterium]
AKTLHDKLAPLGAKALLESLPAIINQSYQPEPQDESQACYAHKLKKSEALIDWNESAVQIERNIRAFNPWPVAQTTLNGETVRIWQASVMADDPATAKPGTVLAVSPDGVLVATGAGVLSLQTVQRAGKKPMPAPDFAHGLGWGRHPQGACFE